MLSIKGKKRWYKLLRVKRDGGGYPLERFSAKIKPQWKGGDA